MIVKDAITATAIVKQIVRAKVFQPLMAKKLKKHWVVKANIGALDDIIITVKLPEKLIYASQPPSQ